MGTIKWTTLLLPLAIFIACSDHSSDSGVDHDLALDSLSLGADLDGYHAKDTSDVYYVNSLQGSDDADGRTPQTAWKTLDKSHDIEFKPGTVLRLARNSVWEKQHLLLDQNVCGTETNPIVIEAYGEGAVPVIRDPRALWDKAKLFPGIAVSETACYLHVLDLRITNGSEGIAVSLSPKSHHIVIGNVEVDGFGTGISLSGEHQVLISNYVHDIGSEGTGSGIGIGIVGKDLEIAYNRLERCQLLRGGKDDGGAFEFYNYLSNVGYDYVSDSIWIHHNRIDNCFNFMESYGNAMNMVIAHNIYTNSPNEALEFHFDDSEHEEWTHVCTYQVLIDHNTFIPAPDADKVGWGIIGLLVDWVPEHNPDPAVNQIEFRNNIFVTNYQVVAFKNVLGKSLLHSHNLFYFLEDGEFTSDETLLMDSTELVAQPQFVDTLVGSYRLLETSPGHAMASDGSDVGSNL